MSLQTLSEWLRCPNCLCDLAAEEPLRLVCPSGHSFDVNKRGFVSLFTGGHGLIGDSAAMLDARSRWLDAGWYEPLRSLVTARIAPEAPCRVLDVGCGTGYYLAAALESADVRALGMDLSPTAVARAVRGRDAVDGLVADVWAPLPVRTGVTDVILNVFAPRNGAEFHRVLRPNGLLLVVVPQDTHLQELRAAGIALNVRSDKAAQLGETLGDWFALEAREALARTLSLSGPEIAALVGMGPSAHHTDASALASIDDASRHPVTTAFECFSFRRRPQRTPAKQQ